MKNNESESQRKFDRINLDRQVKLEFEKDFFYSKVNNLSLGGMHIRGDFQKQEGEYCLVNIYRKVWSIDLSLRASAKVVRKNNKGIAIEFVSMPFGSYMFLQSTLPEANDYPFQITDNLPLSPEANIHISN